MHSLNVLHSLEIRKKKAGLWRDLAGGHTDKVVVVLTPFNINSTASIITVISCFVTNVLRMSFIV